MRFVMYTVAGRDPAKSSVELTHREHTLFLNRACAYCAVCPISSHCSVALFYILHVYECIYCILDILKKIE